MNPSVLISASAQPYPTSSLPTIFLAGLLVAVTAVIFAFRWINRCIAQDKKEETEDQAKWPASIGTVVAKWIVLPHIQGNLICRYLSNGSVEVDPSPETCPNAEFRAEIRTPKGERIDLRVSREVFAVITHGKEVRYASGRFRNDPPDAPVRAVAFARMWD